LICFTGAGKRTFWYHRSLAAVGIRILLWKVIALPLVLNDGFCVFFGGDVFTAHDVLCRIVNLCGWWSDDFS
jgi:hypothetical protein